MTRHAPALAFLALLTLNFGAYAGAVSPEWELLERALNPNFPGGVELKIQLGQVPSNLGFSLPQGSRVVGSVISDPRHSDFPAATSVYFDLPVDSKQAQSLLAGSLTQAGWQPLPDIGMYGPFASSGGFQATAPLTGASWYRRNPDRSAYFTLKTVGKVTQVYLTINAERDLDGRIRMATLVGQNPANLLPKLAAPAGANVLPQGGGSNGDDITQAARIESELNQKDLLEHYAAQLRKAGWTALSAANKGALMTTLWTFKQGKDERLGLFTINQSDKGVYRAVLATMSQR